MYVSLHLSGGLVTYAVQRVLGWQQHVSSGYQRTVHSRKESGGSCVELPFHPSVKINVFLLRQINIWVV